MFNIKEEIINPFIDYCKEVGINITENNDYVSVIVEDPRHVEFDWNFTKISGDTPEKKFMYAIRELLDILTKHILLSWGDETTKFFKRLNESISMKKLGLFMVENHNSLGNPAVVRRDEVTNH